MLAFRKGRTVRIGDAAKQIEQAINKSPILPGPGVYTSSVTSVNIPTSGNVAAGPTTYYQPKWPQHVHDHDSMAGHANYLNDMTDAVVKLQDLVKGLEDRNRALEERLELLEDDFAG